MGCCITAINSIVCVCHVFVHACLCERMFMRVYIHMCVHARKSQRSTLDIFPQGSPTLFLDAVSPVALVLTERLD